MSANEDFSRQSFLGANAPEIFAATRATIVGLGGGGSHIAQQLAHIGVGEIRLIDPDRIESSNLNRLVGATHDDVAQRVPKVEIAQRVINAVRPWITVVPCQRKWQEAASLLQDSHVVFGCLDGYRQRDYLEGAARRYCLPYIDIGMDVTQVSGSSYAIAGQMITTLPGGPCLRCLGFITPDQLAREENRYSDAGINPQVVWSNGTLASLAVGAFVRLFTPWCELRDQYTWLEMDVNAQTVVASHQPDHVPKFAACPHRGGRDGLGDPFFAIDDIATRWRDTRPASI